MKKNIIIAAIAAASALLLSVSCQKENQPESQNGINAGANTFTATIEQSLTKTTLTDAYKVNWTTGDKININGVTFKATADGTDATKATFAKDPETQNDPTGTLFKAIFPESLCGTDAQGEPFFKLPDTQIYSAGAFNAPMYAESSTQSLTFKNICAVLAIKVTSDDITTLKSIKVKANKKLNGTFTVASTTGGYKATIGTDGTEEVVLSSSDAISLTSEGTTFYIAIPEQTYSYLKIYLSEDGNLYKRAMITKKAAGLGTIECNKIYNIDYQTNAVQLYADGPYWSTMNIGATTETGFGQYFGWGEKTGHALTTDAQSTLASSSYVVGTISNAFEGNYYFGAQPTIDGDTQNPITLPASNDAATVNWGEVWKMPTKQNFTDLANACKSEGYSSGKFEPSTATTAEGVTDKGIYHCSNYSGTDGIKGLLFCDGTNKLFFPVAGYGYHSDLSDAGSQTFYWSSSHHTSKNARAYCLIFSSNSVSPQGNDNRLNGFSVRPVSD